MCADDVGAGFFDVFTQQYNLIPGHTAIEHIHRCYAKNYYEFFANGRAYPPNDFDGETHAIFVAAAPFVGSSIGFFN